MFFPRDEDKPFGYQDEAAWRRYTQWMLDNDLLAEPRRRQPRDDERVPAGRGDLSAPAISLRDARRLALHAQGLAVAPPRGTGRGPTRSQPSCGASAACSSTPSRRSRAARCSCCSRGSGRCARRRSSRRPTSGARCSTRGRTRRRSWRAPTCRCSAGRCAWRSRATARAPSAPGRSWRPTRGFADELVEELRERGPLRARELEDRSAEPWRHGWWTDEVSGRQTIARMLHLLWITGRVGVGRRDRAASACGTSSSAA